jgi:CspA family cold shock protein
MRTRLLGTVKWFSPDKGFGFIVRDDGGEDAFVHARAFAAADLPLPGEGERLSFELENDPRGRGQRATKLAKVAADAA